MVGFTAVVPLPSAADGSLSFCQPEVGTRLQDVNLIVVGRGPLAEELVTKRRASGGRVCWLLTDEKPIGAEVILDDGEEKDGWRSASFADEEVGKEELLMSIDHFMWNPCGLAVSSASKKNEVLVNEAKHLRQRFSYSELSWRTTGPYIMPLFDSECYSLLTVSGGRACGIRVLHREIPEIVWELPGAVVFAGVVCPSFANCLPICPVKTFADVQDMDLDCLSEEAKPYAIVDPKHVAIWSLIMFAQFVIFFVFMSIFETEKSSGHFPWWRATYSLFHGAIGGLTATPYLFGPCLTGREITGKAAFVCLVTCACTHFAAPLVPLNGSGTRVSIYLAECLGFGVYFPISLYFQFKYPKVLVDPLPFNARRVCRHMAWFFTVAWGCFGNWMVFYAVGLLYVYISKTNESIASICLPAVVGLIELGTVAGTSFVYNHLVYRPRVLTRSVKGSVVGDQKLRLIVPICLTHAYAECARILCVFAVTVKNPHNPWILSLVSSLLWNVGARLYGSTFLASVLFPRRYCWIFAPDAGTVLHNEARLCFGYLRYVVLAVLAVSSILMNGFAVWPLFNASATFLVGVAFCAELLEDFIVLSISHWASTRSWRATLAPFYSEQDPLSPLQVMSVNQKGVQMQHRSLAFEGMRNIDFYAVVLCVCPPVLFSYTLLTLLLGAGYVHGVCHTPMPTDCRLLDGLFWSVPLACSC
eukprot:TRINITY_DN11998_c1_g1_i1.p1 TRINITY_DN11998_c1_g1~~TRINITY_DN11998_c1_g1_i1.p1  ORF type:complete len:700 (+),score=49.39 TRINITY_DN11998_c1_g1_i1:109-2208(+)